MNINYQQSLKRPENLMLKEKEMREEMKNSLQREQMAERLSERRKEADRLLESRWLNEPEIGEGIDKMYENNPDKARSLAFALQMQEAHLQDLTETQISSTFQTTPENLMRVVRLGYPNSVRGELFMDFQMETARDSIYYLSPVYGKTKRGATASNVTHESAAYRYGSEIEEDSFAETPNDVITDFTVTVANAPIRPFNVRIIQDDEIIAQDDGSGNIVGALLASGTVNYTTGAIAVSFSAAPATGTIFVVETYYDSEVEASYDELGSIELQLKDYQFRVRPYPLVASWSKMTELLIGTTLNIDAEEALVSGAADELKKSLDYIAIREAWRGSKKNTTVTFDIDGAVGESEIDRAMAISRAINQASDVMYNSINRGGVTKIVGGPDAVSYLMLHRRFNAAGRQPMVGAHRVGSLDGVDVYKAPQNIVDNDTLLCIYKNELNPEDVSVACGTLVPLYRTDNTEFKELYSETGLCHFGDIKTLQSAYLVRLQLQNL